jgi:D-3-phosphoglycerate dehydrogenase / 2-oxoglutarate reductase
MAVPARHVISLKKSFRNVILRAVGSPVMPGTALPTLFFDRALPLEYHDLLIGRAVASGPDEADLAVADGIIAGMRRWDAAGMAKAPRARVISRTGVGYDTVDVAAAQAAGIAVCYTPAGPTVSTAEHTLALLLAVTKGLPDGIARADQGLPVGASTGLELDGCTLGLIGLGRIARRVAVVAVALGMQVVASDPFVEQSGIDGVVMASMDQLLEVADVVSLHAPAMAETHHLMNAETFAKMKSGAYLINCARGSLVDQDALLAALDAGQLGGAALDVTEPEPLPVGHGLLAHPKVIVTPHMASSTAAGRRRLYQQAIDNALGVLSGGAATLVPGSTRPGASAAW